jgi:hypothetical protein
MGRYSGGLPGCVAARMLCWEGRGGPELARACMRDRMRGFRPCRWHADRLKRPTGPCRNVAKSHTIHPLGGSSPSCRFVAKSSVHLKTCTGSRGSMQLNRQCFELLCASRGPGIYCNHLKQFEINHMKKITIIAFKQPYNHSV